MIRKEIPMKKLTVWVCAAILGIAIGSDANEIELTASPFDESSAISHLSLTEEIAVLDEQWEGSTSASTANANMKSPSKAFLMSLVLPGAGQWYYGSKTKAVAFVGVEAASWLFHMKFHSDGDDLTRQYEDFSAAHWSRMDYQEYLTEAYGVTDDDQLHETEVSHHLPETNSQQYYEMTGKYDQFAWGWDDATRHGMNLDSAAAYYSDTALRITSDTSAPQSANRITYNAMRGDANKKYDKATRILFVVMGNHLASAFEALISTKKLNKKISPALGALGNVKMKASLKSVYAKRDTPYVTLSYKFF
jgi:hypothetical protein